MERYHVDPEAMYTCFPGSLKLVIIINVIMFNMGFRGPGSHAKGFPEVAGQPQAEKTQRWKMSKILPEQD